MFPSPVLSALCLLRPTDDIEVLVWWSTSAIIGSGSPDEHPATLCGFPYRAGEDQSSTMFLLAISSVGA
jgi:hypothetical protein